MLSVIIPTLNEAGSIREVVQNLAKALTETGWVYEIIVVDDHSSDGSAQLAKSAGARVIQHGSNHGYGQAIRSGLAAAKYDLIALIDGDGSYHVDDLVTLTGYADAFDMVVGARTGVVYTKGTFKFLARRALISFCEFVTGSTIRDINSGLRIFRKAHAKKFLNELAYGFSFTTSLTMCMLLNGYFVGYVDVRYLERQGTSKVRHVRDTLRTAQIVLEAFARYNPLKLFLVILAVDMATALVSTIGVAAHLGQPMSWLVLNISVFTVSIIAGMAFLAVMLTRRADKMLSPRHSIRDPEILSDPREGN